MIIDFLKSRTYEKLVFYGPAKTTKKRTDYIYVSLYLNRAKENVLSSLT